METPTLVAENNCCPGNPTLLRENSPSSQYSVLFEDEGETGYFYGLDTTMVETPVVDALHIYNVSNITDRDVPSLIQIIWSADGLKVVLLINNYVMQRLILPKSVDTAETIFLRRTRNSRDTLISGMMKSYDSSNSCQRTSHSRRRLLHLFSRPLWNPLKYIFEKQNINQLSSFVLGEPSKACAFNRRRG